MDSRAVLSVALAASSLTAAAAQAAPLQRLPTTGQTPTVTSSAAPGLPIARAHRVEQGPEIDGDVLGEAVWAAASPETGFRQNTPDEGEPASERTEVRIVYTGDTIYFGVVCFVRDSATIIVSDARRDSSLVETDSFQIVLDTYRDQQNGFVARRSSSRTRGATRRWSRPTASRSSSTPTATSRTGSCSGRTRPGSSTTGS